MVKGQVPLIPRVEYVVGSGPLLVGRHGWLFWRPGPLLDVRVRVLIESDGHLEVRAVHVQRLGDEKVRGTDLRDIPLGQLERLLRHDDLVANVLLGEENPETLPDFDPSTCSTADAVAQAAKVAGEVSSNPYDLIVQDMVVTFPRRGQRDASFFQQVEELYGRVATNSHRPAAEIAEANNVAVSTVHGWLKEARRLRALEQAISPNSDS